jgi:hypothetical protein
MAPGEIEQFIIACRGCQKRFAQRIAPVTVGDRHLTAASTKVVITGTDAAFRAHKIRQQVVKAPAAIAKLRPSVKVGPLATVIDHAVDGTGAATHLSLAAS